MSIKVDKKHEVNIQKRKIAAFDWLDENVDDLSIEWTGSHSHIYSGNGENIERIGTGRTLLDAVEDCYTLE